MNLKKLIKDIKNYVKENYFYELSITVKWNKKEEVENVFDIIITNKITE